MSCERGITPFAVNYIPTPTRKKDPTFCGHWIRSDLKAADGELYVPGDVISEILSWLPVKSIQRFKCVCRLWCSIAQDRDFIHKHMVRATEIIWAVEDEGNGHHLRSGIQGLILESLESSYRIRNPSTNRVLDLPDTNEKDKFGMALFYVSSTTTFKVSCFFPNRADGNLSFKILTVDADDDSSWRTLDFPFACGLASVSGSLVLLKGVYFLLILLSEQQQQREIVILEVENEMVTRISVPQRGLFSNWSGIGLMDWAGKPSLYQRLGNDNQLGLHVWVVEDYKKQKWAKEIIVIDLTPIKDLCRDYQPCWFYGDRKLEMHCNYINYIEFDIVSKEVTRIDSPTMPARQKFQSRTSLIDFKGMKPCPPNTN